MFRYRTTDRIQRRYALDNYLNEFGGTKPGDLVEMAKQQVLSLSQARAAARALINKVGTGEDPAAERERLIDDIRAEPVKTREDLTGAYFKVPVFCVPSDDWAV